MGHEETAWLRFGQFTHPGSVRSVNQDAVWSFYSAARGAVFRADFGLFVVSDGAGGHLDGERASALAVRALALHMLGAFYAAVLADDPHSPTITETLIQAVERANAAVIAGTHGGGAALTAAVVVGCRVYIGHAGDTRAYVVDANGLEQLTRDHSLTQRLVEIAHLTPAEAAAHPQRSRLYRALGQQDRIDVDIVMRRLPPAARLLLCSDGLWDALPLTDLHRIVAETPDPQAACRALIAAANAAGAADNVSAIIVHLPAG